MSSSLHHFDCRCCFFISRAEKNLVVDLRWFQVFLPEVDMKKSYLWSLTNYFVFKWKHISAQ